MYEVSGVFLVGNTYAVTVKGDRLLLKNGVKLVDQNGEEFTIKSIAMIRYENIENMKRWREFAILSLQGNVDNIGTILKIIE